MKHFARARQSTKRAPLYNETENGGQHLLDAKAAMHFVAEMGSRSGIPALKPEVARRPLGQMKVTGDSRTCVGANN